MRSFKLQNNKNLSVGSSIPEYDSMYPTWTRCRAILMGEAAAKAYDETLDLVDYSNLLIPFSWRMNPAHYKWYVSEAELPGLTAQYAKLLASGLLRKFPIIKLPENLPDEAHDWIKDSFTDDNRSIVSFLDSAIWEEVCTQRCVISVDFPRAEEGEDTGPLYPYPILWKAEEVINWQVIKDANTGLPRLSRVVFRFIDKLPDPDNPHHPKLVPTVIDHYLDPETGFYTVQYYRQDNNLTVDSVQGELNFGTNKRTIDLFDKNWVRDGEPIVPKIAGQPIPLLPIFFLNGDYSIKQPLLLNLVDKEISLYNKLSRRNHLLYGATTYTPVIHSDMSAEEFDELVSQGLGSWIKLNPTDKIEILGTPTTALADMDRAIASNVDDLMKLGVRLLSPEEGQSGVSIEIRNASQTAQLGVLNTKISQTMKSIINFMLFWKYGAEFSKTDWSQTEFTLSSDFDQTRTGVQWAQLAADWYQQRLIPRSAFIRVAKQNDILPPEYEDQEALGEIGTDPIVSGGDPSIIQE